jgi:hypothetical protein
MKAIVIMIVPMRETGTRSPNPIPDPGETNEPEPQCEAINKGDESNPPFWTWFVENPAGL